ncbi:MAG: 2-oxo acid dehydrogenase subunit E2 [Deinococcaceae bacterium]
MTDKVAVELPSPFEGQLQRSLVIAQFSDPQVGSVTAKEKSIVEADFVGVSQEVLGSTFGQNRLGVAGQLSRARISTITRAVPAARKLAKVRGIDVSAVVGSGPGGCVRWIDVERWVPPLPKVSEAAVGISVQPIPYKTPKGYGHLETRVPISPAQREVIRQMHAGHLYAVRTLTVDEVDMTALLGLPASMKPWMGDPETRWMACLPFVVKAIVVSLKRYPSLNCAFDHATQELVWKSHSVVCVSSSNSDATVTVPIDATHKSILDVSLELSGSVSAPTECPIDSGFLLSHSTDRGNLFSFPPIDPKYTAVLAIHRTVKKPVVLSQDGQDILAVRPMMQMSLSFDHRVVDGAEAARFCKSVIGCLENPFRGLL